MRSVSLVDSRTCRSSTVSGSTNTGYGQHLLKLGSQHHLVFYNGMNSGPYFSVLTYLSIRGGVSGKHSLYPCDKENPPNHQGLHHPTPLNQHRPHLSFRNLCQEQTIATTSHSSPTSSICTIIHFTYALAETYSTCPTRTLSFRSNPYPQCPIQ